MARLDLKSKTLISDIFEDVTEKINKARASGFRITELRMNPFLLDEIKKFAFYPKDFQGYEFKQQHKHQDTFMGIPVTERANVDTIQYVIERIL